MTRERYNLGSELQTCEIPHINLKFVVAAGGGESGSACEL
jgi:hypothetical protein